MYVKKNFKQSELQAVYETAQKRKDAHPEITGEYNNLLDSIPYHQNMEEAIEEAKKRSKKGEHHYQVWATVNKEGERYYIDDCFIVSNDFKVLKAAEYVGMEQILSM